MPNIPSPPPPADVIDEENRTAQVFRNGRWETISGRRFLTWSLDEAKRKRNEYVGRNTGASVGRGGSVTRADGTSSLDGTEYTDDTVKGYNAEIAKWEGEIGAWDEKKRIADEAEAKRIAEENAVNEWRKKEGDVVRGELSSFDANAGRFTDLEKAVSDSLHRDVDVQYGKDLRTIDERLNQTGMFGSRAYADTLSEMGRQKQATDVNIANTARIAKEDTANKERGYFLSKLGYIEGAKRMSDVDAFNREQAGWQRGFNTRELATRIAEGENNRAMNAYNANVANTMNRYYADLGYSGALTNSLINTGTNIGMMAAMGAFGKPTDNTAGILKLHGYDISSSNPLPKYSLLYGDEGRGFDTSGYSLGGNKGFNTNKYSLF